MYEYNTSTGFKIIVLFQEKNKALFDNVFSI